MKSFYLIGQSIAASPSPKIHKIIYKELNVDAQYSLFETDGLNALPNSFDGLNITHPFKEEIIGLLDKDCSGCSSVNTVKKISGNQAGLCGYSTDGEGFVLDANRLGLDLKRVLLIGAGGAARSIAKAIIDIGGQVFIKSRSPKKADEFCKNFDASSFIDGEKYTLTVNCTPLKNPHGIKLDNCKKGGYYDLKYTDNGDGLGMLIYQAILSERIFLDKNIDLKMFDLIHKTLTRDIK